jgi:uncharacterized BrkB/YihY/UPF0761 family membrane protein
VRVWAEHRGDWAAARVPGVEAALEALERERHAGGGLLAGGLAYRFFLWLVPFGLVVAALLSFWVEADPAAFDDAIEDFGLSAAAAGAATQAIAEEAYPRWYFLVAGTVLLAWFSIGAVRALLIVHAVAWRQRPERVRRPLWAATVFTGAVVLLLALSVCTAWLREQLGLLGIVLTLLLIVVYGAAALAVVGRLPHGEAPVSALVPGALLVAVGTQALHVFVVFYLAPRLGRSSESYGALGAATTILLWLYVVARLITIAAFLNATLWERRAAR